MKRRTKRLNDPPIATKLITVINRLMGLRPFDNPKGEPRILLSFPYLVLLWILLAATPIFMTRIRSSHQKLDVYINFLYFYFYVGTAFSSTILGYYQSKKFLVYEEKMSKVDENLRKLGATAECRGLYATLMILLIAWFLQMLPRFFFSVGDLVSRLGAPIGLYVNCSISYAVNIGAVILIDFITCVGSVKARYGKVNDLLKAFATDGFQTQEKNNRSRALIPVNSLRSKNWMQPWTNFTKMEYPSCIDEQWGCNEKRNWRIQMIKLVHLELCQASNLLFKIFGTQVTLHIRLGVMCTTVALYGIYVVITQSRADKFPVVHIAWGSLVCIVEMGKLYLLSRACEYVCREADETLTVLHACHPPAMDTEMEDEIRQFVLQLSHCQHGCTERYFSQLNHSFLSKCVGTITMYLIIVVQMDQSLTPKYSTVMNNNSITNANNGW